MPVTIRDFFTFPFNNGRGINLNQINVEGEALAKSDDADKSQALSTAPKVWAPADLVNLIENVTGMNNQIVPVFTRYAGVSTSPTFVVSDFTSSSANNTITIPAITVNSYVAIAILNSVGDLTFIRFADSSQSNNIRLFEQASDTVTIGGLVYKYWRTSDLLLPTSENSVTIRF